MNTQQVTAPGRVNLIGEHIDYHNLAVLPMAIQRHIRVAYRRIDEPVLRASSEAYGGREIDLREALKPGPAGDWGNYLKAATEAVKRRWTLAHGIEAAVTSDLPAAAGLSSSSALLTAFTLALLRANGVEPVLAELMDILPDGEQFVGTRGGGMDHAAVLAAKRGCALLVEFAPMRVSDVPIPDSWSFIVAHSLKTAEKSGAALELYNSRRHASAKHVETEAARVREAIEAIGRDDKLAFGKVLCASHASLRDDLQVSCAELDELVESAMAAGALGARLTGAGFGGCALVFCERREREKVAAKLVDGFYGTGGAEHLIFAEASAGALHD